MKGFLWTFLEYVCDYNLFSFVLNICRNLVHNVALNLYFVNAFGAKERSEIHRYHILLNAFRLLIVGIVVAECIGDTLWLCLFA